METERLPRQTLRLIDSHVHLDGVEMLEQSIESARRAGVAGIVAVGMDGHSNRRVLEIANQYPHFVYPALGLHPRSLAGLGEEEIAAELKFIEAKISKVVAIGEIGLDYDKRIVQTTPKQWQQDILNRLLALARKNNKPVSVHALYAWRDTFELVKQSGVNHAVFHWYAGISSVLDDVIKEGYLISATPAAEYHSEHRRAIRRAPLERLLLETDAPVYYGRDPKYRAGLTDIVRSLKAVSEIKGISEELVAEQTTRNTSNFFGLDKLA